MIPFNRPYITGADFEHVETLRESSHLSGDGEFTDACQAWLQAEIGSPKALLTHSCTAALEMAAILFDVQPGDEVIMPSYTFVSTANAFVLRGARPVFIDIREDTLNLNETRIEQALTNKTKAIVPVHYAGVGCAMDTISAIASNAGLWVVEDNAQGIRSRYGEKPLGSFGHLATLSFHETKNVICGEGGALLINDEKFAARAEIVREKGTNRSQFFRGQVDKYTWVDIGSSYLPNELTAAFLYGQLQHSEWITDRRLAIWERYHAAFEPLENCGLVRRPQVPENCQHNAHMYYLILRDLNQRTAFITRLQESGIQTVFHYLPLHKSPLGRSIARTCGRMDITERVGDRLVRLPLWIGVEDHLDFIIETVIDTVETT